MTAPDSLRGLFRRSFVVQVAVLVLVAALGVGGVLTYRASNLRARQTADLLFDLRTVEREIVSAETGLRGYALTREARFLEPYEGAFARIDAGLARLDDHPDVVAEVQALVDEWRTEFAVPILELIEAGRLGDVLDRFASGEGRERIDAIAAVTGELGDELRGQLDDRRATSDLVGVVAASVAAAATAAGLLHAVRTRRRLDERIVAPITSLAAAATELGRGNLGVRSAAGGTAEVDALTAAFNTMADATERTVDELRQLDRRKSEFVSVVSHELRTPLTSIRGSLGLLDAGALGPVPEKAAPMLRIAVANTDRLVRLINDILDLDRIESEQGLFDLRPEPVGDLLAEAAGNVQGAADEAGVRLVVEPSEATVHVDRDRAVQALTNLIGNAVKFSDAGSCVEVRAAKAGDEVVLTVADEGRGIPEDKLEAVFGRFEQVDSSDARDKGGTGLGLAIVRSIAERHGGSVGVVSELGRGSTFELRLPAAS